MDSYARPGEEVNWVQLVEDGDSWTIPFHGLKMDNKEIAIKGTQMVLDTGLSYTMAPIEDINAIERHLHT